MLPDSVKNIVKHHLWRAVEPRPHCQNILQSLRRNSNQIMGRKSIETSSILMFRKNPRDLPRARVGRLHQYQDCIRIDSRDVMTKRSRPSLKRSNLCYIYIWHQRQQQCETKKTVSAHLPTRVEARVGTWYILVHDGKSWYVLLPRQLFDRYYNGLSSWWT